MKKPETSRAICLLWYNSLLPYAIIAWIYHLIIAQKKPVLFCHALHNKIIQVLKLIFQARKKAKNYLLFFFQFFIFKIIIPIINNRSNAG